MHAALWPLLNIFLPSKIFVFHSINEQYFVICLYICKKSKVLNNLLDNFTLVEFFLDELSYDEFRQTTVGVNVPWLMA